MEATFLKHASIFSKVDSPRWGDVVARPEQAITQEKRVREQAMRPSKHETDVCGQSRTTGRGNRSILWAVCPAVALATSLVLAQTSDHGNDDTEELQTSIPAEDTIGAPANGRIREGTEMENQNGYFRLTGDRVTFFTEDGRGRFVVLENLNLERISRVLAEAPDHLQWTVTATVTEYRGGNYLFVRKAVRRDRKESREDEFQF